MCEPLYYSTDALLGAVPFMPLSPSDRTRHWAGRALVFAWSFAVPCALHGAAKGMAFALVPYFLLGFLFFGFSQVPRRAARAGCGRAVRAAGPRAVSGLPRRPISPGLPP